MCIHFRKIANFGSLPKIKKSKIECLFSTWKNANTHFSCLSKKQYADFTTFISSVNPHIGSKTYFHLIRDIIFSKYSLLVLRANLLDFQFHFHPKYSFEEHCAMYTAHLRIKVTLVYFVLFLSFLHSMQHHV